MASTKFNKLYTLLNAYDLSGGDTNSDVLNSKNITDISVAVIQADVTGTTKTVACKLQASADGTNGWFDVDATNYAVTTANSAAASAGFAATSLAYPYLRVNVDAHADVTGGTFTVKVWARGENP